MEFVFIVEVVIASLISFVVIILKLSNQHSNWENSWSRVAESAGVRYVSGNFVNPTNFRGIYHGHDIELMVIHKGGAELVPANIFTRLGLIIHKTIQGQVFITSKHQSLKADIISSKELFDYMYKVRSQPDDLVDLLLSPNLKHRLYMIPLEQLILEGNRLYLLIEGVEAREDVLIDCLALLNKIANNIEAG